MNRIPGKIPSSLITGVVIITEIIVMVVFPDKQ